MPFKARSNDQNKLIVVGIAKSVDDAGLADMFGLYGTVAEAKVVRNDKGDSRGFGFVTYTSAAAKNKAIKHMNQTTVDGRILNVRDVVPKADRDPVASKKEKVKTGVCWAFQKGNCDKGDACPYPHEVKDGEYGSCFEFAQQGKCKRGDACKFLHGTKENDKFDSDQEEEEEEKVKEITPVDPSKPRVCFAFQNGKCHRGKACMFVHEKINSTEPETKKRKRETTDDEDELKALIDAENAALRQYEQAKSARIAKEAQINAIKSHSDTKKSLSTKPKASKEASIKSKATKESSDKSKATKEASTKLKPAKEASTKSKPIKEASAKAKPIKEASAKPIEALKPKKNVDEATLAVEEAMKAMKEVESSIQSSSKKASQSIDMGAAFDSDDEPSSKRAKTSAKESRKLRQQKKKAALQQLKSKQLIDVDHS